MSKSVKEFRNCLNNRQTKAKLQEEYKMKQGIFYKHLRDAEREYNIRLTDEIEDINTNDPVK